MAITVRAKIVKRPVIVGVVIPTVRTVPALAGKAAPVIVTATKRAPVTATIKDSQMAHTHSPACHHHHHHEVSAKTIRWLVVSFVINIVLSVVEIVGGILAGSVALIGDALHNTSDAFSILIAVVAFKISRKKADKQYTYGFKRAEIIGGFVNLILLFISGVYLLVEGVERLIFPQEIDGFVIIWVSVLALLVDAITAKISHHGSGHNTNMRMVFLHNLADALGSVGVIISGLFVVYGGIYRVDGVIALVIAGYMIYQAVLSFPRVVRILMNAAPDTVDVDAVQKVLCRIKGVRGVHHIHIWNVTEHDISLECHLVAKDVQLSRVAAEKLRQEFGIRHCNIQIEQEGDCPDCCLS